MAALCASAQNLKDLSLEWTTAYISKAESKGGTIVPAPGPILHSGFKQTAMPCLTVLSLRNMGIQASAFEGFEAPCLRTVSVYSCHFESEKKLDLLKTETFGPAFNSRRAIFAGASFKARTGPWYSFGS